MGLKDFSLEGKVALITGGGTGIGFGIASAFVDAGAKVIITGRREDVLKNACEKLGNRAYHISCDLSRLHTLPELVKEVETNTGAIDILVNNAGIHLKKWAQETSNEDFAAIMQTNLLAVFALTREVAKGMISRNTGSVIFIGSMAGIFGIDRVSAYGTSKAALTGLMNNLVTEYSGYHVRVNCIAPGWIESEMFFKAIDADPARKQQIVNRIAMPRFGTPNDIGNAALYLSSDAARYVTGVVLPVDGGACVNF